MTHDEMIKVIAAHKAGKKIEERVSEIGGKWTEAREPRWNFSDWEYRVAPELLELWVNIWHTHGDLRGFAYPNKELADQWRKTLGRTVHMREVTETE